MRALAAIAAVAAANTSAAAPAVALLRDPCVYHLHVPKCAGTFVWRFLRAKFCPVKAQICGRATLRAPPARAPARHRRHRP